MAVGVVVERRHRAPDLLGGGSLDRLILCFGNRSLRGTTVEVWVFVDERGRVVPDSFTDGSSEHRRRWFMNGFDPTELDQIIEAIDQLELWSDQGVVHPDLSFDRGVSYLGRAESSAKRPRDLGQAVAAFVEQYGRVDPQLQADLDEMLPQLAGVPLVNVSAIERRGLGRMMQAVFDMYELWNRRIGTGELNRWLEVQIERHPPPAPGGRRIKLRYMTQVNARPPSFAVFSTRGSELPEAYKRYLVNNLRTDFGLKGIPIRLHLRERKNPYAAD